MHSLAFKRTLLVVTLLLCASVALAGAAVEISIEDCPDVVAATILDEFDGAPIHEIESITIEDRTLYIAETRLNGQKVELHVADHGGVILRRADITVASAPLAVQQALFRYGGEIDDLERVSGDGDVRYEAEIEFADDIEVDVVLTEDGAIISERQERD